jgi:hypothetical protein
MIWGVRMIANDKGGTNNLLDRKKMHRWAKSGALHINQEAGQMGMCRNTLKSQSQSMTRIR